MELDAALATVTASLADMRSRAGDATFDEWAIVATDAGARKLLGYGGARPTTFADSLPNDMAPLRQAAGGRVLTIGEFELASDAPGLAHDVFICIGTNRYLVLNQTGASIFASPAWPKLQPLLFSLIGKFRADPLAG